MPTLFSHIASNDTDAHFRQWGLDIATALAAGGLVKTADTGQINWATVLKPTAALNFPGYEIWRFNDSLQGSVPVFFKIQYGSSWQALSPGLQVNIGTGSDGAGNLTGAVSSTLYPGARGSLAATNAPTYVSCGPNRLCFVGMVHNGGDGASDKGTHFALVVERTKDSAGADTNVGLVWLAYGSHNAGVAVFGTMVGCVKWGSTQYYYYINGFPFPTVQNPTDSPFTMTQGTDVGFLPAQIITPRGVETLNSIVACIQADIGPVNTEFDMTMNGASHHFKSLGGGAGGFGLFYGQVSGLGQVDNVIGFKYPTVASFPVSGSRGINPDPRLNLCMLWE